MVFFIGKKQYLQVCITSDLTYYHCRVVDRILRIFSAIHAWFQMLWTPWVSLNTLSNMINKYKSLSEGWLYGRRHAKDTLYERSHDWNHWDRVASHARKVITHLAADRLPWTRIGAYEESGVSTRETDNGEVVWKEECSSSHRRARLIEKGGTTFTRIC